jgi:hypothetical protein
MELWQRLSRRDTASKGLTPQEVQVVRLLAPIRTRGTKPFPLTGPKNRYATFLNEQMMKQGRTSSGFLTSRGRPYC